MIDYWKALASLILGFVSSVVIVSYLCPDDEEVEDNRNRVLKNSERRRKTADAYSKNELKLDTSSSDPFWNDRHSPNTEANQQNRRSSKLNSFKGKMRLTSKDKDSLKREAKKSSKKNKKNIEKADAIEQPTGGSSQPKLNITPLSNTSVIFRYAKFTYKVNILKIWFNFKIIASIPSEKEKVYLQKIILIQNVSQF